MPQSAKDRWNAKHYRQMKFSVPLSVASNFKSDCEAHGVSMASVITKFMCDYSASEPAVIKKLHPVLNTSRQLRRKKMRTIVDTVEALHKAELGSLDNTPDNFRGTDVYAETENIVEALELALDALNEVYVN